MAADSAQIQPILQGLQAFGADIHHGYIVSLAGQNVRHRPAHLSCAQNHDFHGRRSLIERLLGVDPQCPQFAV